MQLGEWCKGIPWPDDTQMRLCHVQDSIPSTLMKTNLWDATVTRSIHGNIWLPQRVPIFWWLAGSCKVCDHLGLCLPQLCRRYINTNCMNHLHNEIRRESIINDSCISGLQCNRLDGPHWRNPHLTLVDYKWWGEGWEDHSPFPDLLGKGYSLWAIQRTVHALLGISRSMHLCKIPPISYSTMGYSYICNQNINFPGWCLMLRWV